MVEETVELPECHVKCESKHAQQQNCQNSELQETHDDVLKHQDIDASICKRQHLDIIMM